MAGLPAVPKPPAVLPRNASLVDDFVSLARYMSQTEVHTYAFSVAANTILSLFPFIVMMFTVARQVFHSKAMESAIADMIHYFLPTGQDFVTKNMEIVANARSGVQVISVVMLLVSSTGVFLPLEVALNRVWGVTRNRSYVFEPDRLARPGGQHRHPGHAERRHHRRAEIDFAILVHGPHDQSCV